MSKFNLFLLKIFYINFCNYIQFYLTFGNSYWLHLDSWMDMDMDVFGREKENLNKIFKIKSNQHFSDS